MDELPEDWNQMGSNRRTNWLANQLRSRNAELAQLVEQLMPSAAGNESAHRRALLDAYLALMEADTADKHAKAENEATKRLTCATWTLVAFTAVLAVATIVMAIATIVIANEPQQ